MNARAVQALSVVVHAAMQTHQTAAGIAVAVDEAVCAPLRAQIAELESPRVRPAPRPMRFEGVPDAVLEAALRSFVACHLDYDMHKYLEEPEDGSPDRYPELTRELAKGLALEAAAAGFEVEPWDAS